MFQSKIVEVLLTRSNVEISHNVLLRFLLENTISKFEYNCQVNDIIHNYSNPIQQRSWDVFRNSRYNFTKKI